jgi:translation elongation factor EF-1beta
MSEIFDAKPKDDEAEKAEIEEKFKKVQAKKVRKQNLATADKGEAIMNSDDPTAMYAFS